jgi:hypothetical protein
MKKFRLIAFFIWIGTLPVSSNAQIWFPYNIEPGQPFDIAVTVTFPTAGYSITNFTADVSGTNINIQVFTPASVTGYVAQVITYEQIVIEIPAQPEGNYICNVTVSGKGTVYPNTVHFSIPQSATANPYQLYLFGGIQPTFTKTNNMFRYIHLQLCDAPTVNYIVETCTNLTKGIWLPLTDATTNVLGGAYDKVAYSIPETNSQIYVRTRVIIGE